MLLDLIKESRVAFDRFSSANECFESARGRNERESLFLFLHTAFYFILINKNNVPICVACKRVKRMFLPAADEVTVKQSLPAPVTSTKTCAHTHHTSVSQELNATHSNSSFNLASIQHNSGVCQCVGLIIIGWLLGGRGGLTECLTCISVLQAGWWGPLREQRTASSRWTGSLCEMGLDEGMWFTAPIGFPAADSTISRLCFPPSLFHWWWDWWGGAGRVLNWTRW